MSSMSLEASACDDARQRYEQLIATIDGIVWEADAQTLEITFASGQAESLLGYPVLQWLAPGFWVDHLHPDDRDRALEDRRLTIREQRRHNVEYRMIAADGRAVWLRDTVSAVAEGAEVRGLRGIMVDITDRKQAEVALREREELYQLRVEQEPQSRLRFLDRLDQVNRAIQGTNDLEQMMQDVLDALLAIFGCDRAWLMYPCDPEATLWRMPMERTRPEYPGGMAIGVDMPMDPSGARMLDILREANGPVQFGPAGERPVPCEMAQYLGVQSLIAMALYPKVGKPWSLGLHQCSYPHVWSPDEVRLFQEIGRRVADALTSVLAYRDLQESEARLRTLVDHASDAIFLHDDQGIILDVNRQACESLGYRREELIGITPFAFDHGIDLSFNQRLWAQHTAGDVVVFDTHHRRKDGAMFPVEIRNRPFQQGGRRFSVSLARDISERKRLEEQFRQAQKMEAVGRLAGGVAHDFNNLLTVINGNSELVFDSLQPDDPNRELVALIQKSGERAANLTRQLLAFSRKQILQPQVVNLNTLLGELSKLLQRLLGDDIELALIPGDGLGLTKIDAGQFEQAIINLAVNARDAMRDGGRLTIETRNIELAESCAENHPEIKPDRYIQVTVSDSGEGMDEAIRAQIFEPFFTTKEAGKGTGLGLAMVYGFVKQSGGHIEAYSELGRGATFKVYLPRVDERLSISTAPVDLLEVRNGTETILVAEDEVALRTQIKIVLQSHGYKVLAAGDGQEAAQIAQQYSGVIHLVVIDLVMPRMSGRQLADLLTQARPGVRVLYMSGYTDEAVLHQGVLAAGVAFLQKPFTPMRLAHKVRQVLDAKEELR